MPRIFLVVCLTMLTACSGPIISTSVVPAPTVTSSSPALLFTTQNNPGVSTPTVLADSWLAFPSATPADHVLATPSYTLKVVLDYASHSLVADEAIIYQNATGQTLNSIVMAVEPNLWAGCFHLDSLTLDGKDTQGMFLNSDRLEVPLIAPLSPGKNLNFSFHYSLNLPPAGRYHVFGYNSYQINLIDWYPFIVPYSNGWLMHPPAAVGEHLVYDTASFDVTVSLARGSDSLTIAASGPVETTNGIWHYHLQNARTFCLFSQPQLPVCHDHSQRGDHHQLFLCR